MFKFDKDHMKAPNRLFTEQCIQFTYKNDTKQEIVNSLPNCGSSPGLKYKFLNRIDEDYSKKCVGIQTEDCKNLCKQSGGILENFENDEKNPICVKYQVSRMVCIGVETMLDDDEKLKQFDYKSGCFFQGSPIFYQNVQLNQTVKLKEMVNKFTQLEGCHG